MWRRGAPKELAATVTELGTEHARVAAEPEARRANLLGLVVSELTPGQRYELKTEGGLLVRNARGSTVAYVPIRLPD